MIGIEFTFPANRYHATPWDRQVNEGAVEWPPSPWRLIRALIATWHRKASTEFDDDTFVQLVEALSTGPPQYDLPKGVKMHTRHYMPPYKDNTNKVFDTFLHITEEKPLQIAWPDVDLDGDTNDLFATLVRRIGYLGRAESWVEGRVLNNSDLERFEPNAAPENVESPVNSGECVELLAPIDSADYEEWRDPHVETFTEKRKAYRRGRGWSEDLSETDLDNLERAVPEEFIDAVRIETSTLKEFGWNRPPASQWLTYRRPDPEQKSAMNETIRLETSDNAPCVARYRVTSNVPPRLTDAITVGDKMRAALKSKAEDPPPEVFSGKNEDGEPLSGHRHIHVISEALGKHGRISHITLYADMGFDDKSRRAIEKVRKLWDKKLDEDVGVVLLGFGEREDFAGDKRQAGQSLALHESNIWQSRTPFVPTRHGKKTSAGDRKYDDDGFWIGGPRHDLRRILVENGYPEPVRIEEIEATELDGSKTRWLEFRTDRGRGGGKRATYRGFGFEIEFDEVVAGPLCAGYGSHYGLGQFEPLLE